MKDLLKDVSNEIKGAFNSCAVAAAVFAMLCWELLCVGVALVMSIGSLTFGQALLYVNIFGFGLLVLVALIGVAAVTMASVTIAAIKKEKEEEEEDE